MANYDWREFENRNPVERFPGDFISNGLAEWTAFVENFPYNQFSFNRQPQPIKCPRVFVSHKQEDEQIARRIAWLAVQKRFEFWLDVLDPPLQAFLAQKGRYSTQARAYFTAAIIEMGLINCTHVIASVTKQSRTSRWIPYEYGRVKDTRTLVGPAACWTPPSERKNLPEYLLLSNISHTEQDIKDWLDNEFTRWSNDNPYSNCSGGEWKDGEPDIKLNDIF